MKIYHLSGSAIPSRSANSIQVMRMASAFAALGHDVTLFCRPGENAGHDDSHAYYGVPAGFDIVRCRWPPVTAVGGLWHAYEIMRCVRERGTPDVFYGRHMTSLSLALRCGTPVRAEVHGPARHVLQRHVVSRVVRSPRLDRLITVSGALRDEYRRLFPGVARDKIVVAHSAADPDVHDVPARPIGGRPGAPRVGYVGHLYPGKGLELISRLAALMPHVDFHVIGGTDWDLARWRRGAARQNLLFHGHVPPADLAGWMGVFKIALLPYQRRVRVSGGGDMARWMSPLKLFEYMAYSKAIVASDLPVIREVVEDGVTAMLCTPDAPGSWCSAIQRLIESSEAANAMGERARRLLLGRYTWVHRARLVLE
jgi:glycosyltransferase involved in cell wall biosynthesis